jgi:short-subunit dehydrogenase
MNAMRVARLVTPALLERKAGSIVNISTFGDVEPSLRFPVSSAMRAALGAYAKLYSQRYTGSGLRVNNVPPGFIDTYPADEATRAAIPAGRVGTADEVARVVGFLASLESSYVTGECREQCILHTSHVVTLTSSSKCFLKNSSLKTQWCEIRKDCRAACDVHARLPRVGNLGLATCDDVNNRIRVENEPSCPTYRCGAL